MSFMESAELSALRGSQGSISVITDREGTGDRSVTLDKFDREVLFSRYPDGSFARKGGAAPNGNPDEHVFLVNPHDGIAGATPRDVYVVHPKQDKNELRLYAAGTGLAFNPGEYFYLFVRDGEQRPFLGTISNAELQKLREFSPEALEEITSAEEIDDDGEDAGYQQAIGSTAAKLPVGFFAQRYPRDPNVAIDALERAEFLCEIANDGEPHATFRSAATQNPFVEAHHLIPLSRQADFEVSLDVPENVVALCPTCHRRLHHAIHDERVELLLMLLARRAELLEARGINVDEKYLLSAYGV